ncbi:MAG: CHASE3 domain-containing protein [Verrucomicrobia bacterium]|nr:CHASE3 domain-containing protein [Verrucomicrobiota bacterium]
MQLSVTKKVTLGFAASLGVMGAIAVISYLSTQRLIDDIGDVAQSYQTMGEVRDAFNVVSRMNSSVRGYIITGQEGFLAPFHEALKETTAELQQVRDLTAEKPEQRQRLEAIEKLVVQQVAYSTNLIAIRKEKGFDAAEEVVVKGEGKKRVGLILEMVQEMLKHEEDLLAQRRGIARESVWLANGLIVLGGVLAITILGIATTVLRQDVRDRERLERAILEIGDSKQQQFGHDLHDGVCQELAGIAFMGQVIERKLAAQSAAEAAEVAKMTALVSKAASHARSLARGLQPVDVESNGLMVALEEMAHNVGEMFHIECKFECEGEVLIGDSVVAVHLYRIAQEAVHNAIRHGGARKVVIRLRAAKDLASLEIRDDGKGMPDVLPEQKGMGIETMRYRATVIGATLEFRRAPSKGTLVKCSFKPVPPRSGTRTKVLSTI